MLINHNGRLTCQPHTILPGGSVIVFIAVILSTVINGESRSQRNNNIVTNQRQLLDEFCVIYN